MAITIDPQEREVRVFERLARLHGKRVLEIGCGDGRLTRRLASLGARVSAIDPDAGQVRLARASLTRSLSRRIEYRVGRAERLLYHAREFDAVVFSWAL
jgi:2-polyprenyl-3-methyl-5-hydroxy-6-metoxy-1,4-benzoquinol methylase